MTVEENGNVLNDIVPGSVRRIHLVGVAGTGMGAFAGMLKAAGYEVTGSDENVYPPMSDMLAAWEIDVFTPYSAENIERATQGYGSVRPEEARETRRRQLENERTRLRSQFKILETSKSRLEVASTSADNEVDQLRAKLQQRRDMMDSQPPEKRKKPKQSDQPSPEN